MLLSRHLILPIFGRDVHVDVKMNEDFHSGRVYERKYCY